MSLVSTNQQKLNEMVKVVVRCRPMNETEKSQHSVSIVKIYSKRNAVEVCDLRSGKVGSYNVFTFDGAYNSDSLQSEVYEESVRPLVDAVLCGFNSTVFAYGQSGTGKTYTIEGNEDEETRGIIPRTFQHIFYSISTSYNIQYLVRVSYLEIYQNEIRDLLDPKSRKKYEVRESKELGVYVKNISSFICKSEKEVRTIMASGKRNRTVGTTDMNDRSSRSHAIITITIETKDLTGPMENQVRVGKLNLVDLAGSERQHKTNAMGSRLRESSKINLSLAALGNVISALADSKGQFVPYRDSKLTRLLRDSLGGNSKTLMIANIGPALSNYDETINTLRYASRARNIKNVPQINEDPFNALLRKYQDEITRLRSQLAERTALNKRKGVNSGGSTKLKELNLQKRSISEQEPSENKTTCDNNEGIVQLMVVNSNEKSDDYVKDEYVCELIKRIQSMESRLLIGSDNIIEHTSRQQEALEARSNEILKLKLREKEICQLLEQQQEVTVERKEEYSGLEQEVEVKSKELIEQLYELQEIQKEILDAKEEFNTDRRELEVTQRELLKYLKLRLLVMENFIPNRARRTVLSRLHFDEESETWKLVPECNLSEATLSRPQCVEYLRRPVSLYAALTRRKANHEYRCGKTTQNREKTFRFKVEDILELQLVESSRTTKEYQTPKIPSVLNSMFQTALQNEEDIDIDAASSSSSFCLTNKSSTRSLDVTKTVKKSESVQVRVYPKARGLVPK